MSKKRAEEMGADALLRKKSALIALASQEELYDHYVAWQSRSTSHHPLQHHPPAEATSSCPGTVQALCRDVDVIVGAKGFQRRHREPESLHPA